MQQANLVRTIQSSRGTFGTWILNDTPLVLTLEPAIPMPEGNYLCIPHDSPKHPHCWEVSNVPGHTAVLVHVGNTIDDTELCALVGTGLTQNMKGRVTGRDLPAITNSDLALNILRVTMESRFMLRVCSAMQFYQNH